VEQELEVEEGRLTSLGNTSLMLQVLQTVLTMHVGLKVFVLFVMCQNDNFTTIFQKFLLKIGRKRMLLQYTF
jgi:hypothetical protein